MKFRFSISLLLLLVALAAGFLAGHSLPPSLVKKQELSSGRFRLTAPVGTSVRIRRTENDTFLVMPFAGANGVRRGDIGVVTRKDDVVAIIVVNDMTERASVAKVVRRLIPDLTIGFGDLVEMTVLEPEIRQELNRAPRPNVLLPNGS